MASASRDEIREMFDEFIDLLDHRLEKRADEKEKRAEAKLRRLENSINKLVNYLDAMRNGEPASAVLKVTTELENADIALASITLPKEEYYTYSCSQLAEKLDVRPYDVQMLIKKLGLRGDPRYHLCIKSGKKGQFHKWSAQALEAMRDALKASPVGR